MRYSIDIVTQPKGQPISLANAKAYLRVTNNLEDELIDSLIGQAANHVELYLRRSLITRDIKLTLDSLPMKNSSNQWWDGVQQGAIGQLSQVADTIILPYPPIVSVTSITSYSSADASSVLDTSNYFLDASGSRICLKQGGLWPVDLRSKKAMEIIYKAGYGSVPSDIPQGIQGAVRAMVSFLYQNRDCLEIPESIENMLKPYRIIDSIAYN